MHRLISVKLPKDGREKPDPPDDLPRPGLIQIKARASAATMSLVAGNGTLACVLLSPRRERWCLFRTTAVVVFYEERNGHTLRSSPSREPPRKVAAHAARGEVVGRTGGVSAERAA